ARPHPPTPLVWFALTDHPPTRIGPAATSTTATAPATRGAAHAAQAAVGGWRLDTTRAEYTTRFDAVRAAIAAGETYQCNLSARMTGLACDTTPEALFGYYRSLLRNQGGDNGAWLVTDRFAVASASPESFFEWRGDEIRCTPMKGTSPRGPDSASDEVLRRALLASAKDRAENVMIVDLMRNDLSRIAAPGSVQVPALLACERYATLWQLTSTITARIEREASLAGILAALFPCGSVTGAPKARTMELIAQLETSPRGLYCGAIGWLAPPGHAVRARFNVAIRTVVVDRTTGRAEYGVGGGITWGSSAEGEFAEILAKTAVLRDPPEEDFSLIETLREHDGRPVHLTEHLARLRASAHYFGFPLEEDEIRARLAAATAPGNPDDPDNPGDPGNPGNPPRRDGRGGLHGDRRLRIALDRHGRCTITVGAAPKRASRPRTLAIDTPRIDPRSRWLRHKTTLRAVYAAARERHPEADDTVLVNTNGNITETSIANIVVRLAGLWFTPPVADGCLPGVGRGRLIADGIVQERSLSIADLRRADAIAVVSSLRGWLPAVLADPSGEFDAQLHLDR
ncbi:MAG TPA: aminodeoxychorismate synthase component I, partial [Microbacteriaceae bacterium]|nr:aminodeoxychorismate synthase component I [Microbacteriaceae bacterium]